MSQILVRESFLKGSMFVPNFMKIERGPDFFFVDLVWNDPYKKFLYKFCIQKLFCNKQKKANCGSMTIHR